MKQWGFVVVAFPNTKTQYWSCTQRRRLYFSSRSQTSPPTVSRLSRRTAGGRPGGRPGVAGCRGRSQAGRGAFPAAPSTSLLQLHLPTAPWASELTSG